MILYHGGTDIIERPEIREPNRGLDFGAGFYTTTNADQAVQYALRMRDVRQRRDKNNTYNAVVSVFEFDFTAASACCDVLQFSQTNEEWLDFITEIGERPIPASSTILLSVQWRMIKCTML